MRILGIDPGINGSAVLFVGGAACPVTPENVIDLPTVGSDKQREIDVLALRDWMLQMQPDVAVIERVTPMPAIPDEHGNRPSMGATSAFNYGKTFGVLKSIPLLFNIPTVLVTAGKWKGFYGLKGKGNGGKEQARQLALQRWPTLSGCLSRKKDQDRAEAVLIANYLWKIETGQVEPKLAVEDKIRPIASMLEISRRLDDDIDDIPE